MALVLSERNSAALFLLVFLPAVCENAVGQENRSIAKGDRIRVSAPPVLVGHKTGSFVALSNDTLEVTCSGSRDTLKIPLAVLATIEISRGKTPFGKTLLKGAGLGFLIGAAAGTLVGASAGGHGDISGLDVAWICACLGGGSGVVVGGVVGVVTRSESWTALSVDGIQQGYRPSGPASLHLSIRIPL